MPLPWPNKLMFEISGQSIFALPDPDQKAAGMLQWAVTIILAERPS
jgi:hypothetical protein